MLVELTVAFVVFCADSIGENPRIPLPQRVARSVVWPVTLSGWFTHRSLAKLARFGAIIWLLLTSGWLLSLEHDHLRGPVRFFIAAELTMAFVVYCVDAMASDLQRKPLRRVVRSGLWIKALTEYFRDPDSIRVIQASLTTWILLTTGWLLSLEVDRIARPLGWLSR